MYPSLEERKRGEAARREAAVSDVVDLIRPFARSCGGRFLLYGSAARGEMRYDSDVDFLLDFPAESEAEAWRLVEELCHERKIEVDIKPLSWCAPGFVEKVRTEAAVIA